MNDKLLKPYNPKETEGRIYKLWEESGFFNPDNLSGAGDPYTIVLPLPNRTGTLHTGHAFMLAIQDAMIRYKRMQGHKALWVPGTDHAAIATQTKVEKLIYKKEGKTRHDLGREELLRRIHEFADESHKTIISQLKKMGASLDWSREAYPLDEPRSIAVKTAFKQLYDLGLIYRGHKVVNWDPKSQTTLSNDEVVYEARKTKFYTFKYSKDFPIPIATTRPETKVGDTAVAVHPNDVRYKEFIGKEYDVEFAGAKLRIKVIADKDADPEFGTGAVGVTPAHSAIDEAIAQRNDLPAVQVIDEYAKMTTEAGPLVSGKKVKEAREIIVEWLQKEGLLEKEEEIEQNVAKSYRSNGLIEPLPKLQWFIDVNKEFTLPHSNLKGIKSGDKVNLKKLMQTVVENNQVKIIPDRFNKIYFHWVNNLRDWCISRQIWFGHQIPVYYCRLGNPKFQEASSKQILNSKSQTQKGCELPIVSIENMRKCPHCGGEIEQDPDTLDTWFSSALWTFSTLGWPNNTEDLKTYHPTDVLETGYDILFFWVARMILMSTTLLGEIPFKTVYLHGMIRDEKGQKMSKSLDNAIDPVELIDEFGADALRMAMMVGVGPGNDITITNDKVKAYKHFANKLWNITRFILSNTEDFDRDEKIELNNEDQKRIDELNNLTKEITPEMEDYKFYIVGEKLYHYAWHTLADVILEESKEALKGDDEQKKKSKQKMLLEILGVVLKLLHPFMPFITEELWGILQGKEKPLIIETWPKT